MTDDDAYLEETKNAALDAFDDPKAELDRLARELVYAAHTDDPSAALAQIDELTPEIPEAPDQRIPAPVQRRLAGLREARTHWTAALSTDAPIEEREALLRRGVEALEGHPRDTPLDSITEARPESLLSLSRRGGALLTRGMVAILAGEGGVAKSTLSLSLALDFASADREVEVAGGIFTANAPGPVLLAGYEDHAGFVAARARSICDTRAIEGEPEPDLSRVRWLSLAGDPIFGPREVDGVARYNSRPVPLEGWRYLWRAADRVKPNLIIIDPVSAAYVGEGNATAQVREFMTLLATEAHEHGCGVLLIAHSTKATRTTKANPFDAGMVSGSAAWVDSARAAISMTRREVGEDSRRLAVAKANYGPARLVNDITMRRDNTGAPVGFESAPEGWQPLPERKPKTEELGW